MYRDPTFIEHLNITTMTSPHTTTPADLIKAVQTYFDALYYCDTTLLNQVFHQDSSLFDVDQGKVFVESIQSFSDDVGQRVSPASKEQTPEAEILLIDWLSPQCATVKIRIRAHQNVFVDHLGFVHGEKGWQIVSKIWHLERVLQ
ncbi:nuclear transport factor 2 family protein [Gangjinia marincola]|uniref:Nuclear transport factor 2 family protein n=1 Tax=Gangjinia marincola TaxID=578463 RepID=A0ABN1MFA3_9FLAO